MENPIVKVLQNEIQNQNLISVQTLEKTINNLGEEIAFDIN